MRINSPTGYMLGLSDREDSSSHEVAHRGAHFGRNRVGSRPSIESRDSTPWNIPHWMRHAACQDIDEATLQFVPSEKHGGTKRIERCLAVCARCTVKDHCADFAASTGVRYGVWGGENFSKDGADRVERVRVANGHRVYFAFGSRPAVVKIGTSSDVDTRCSVLGLTLIASEPGSYQRERQLHKKFSESREGDTEWFGLTKRLAAYIAELHQEAAA